MHMRLSSLAGLQSAATNTSPTDRCAHAAHRHSDRVRSEAFGTRLLTVGTDCALGKKYTALAIARGLRHGESMRRSALRVKLES
jgi:uncharacterized NAD-dependent epimerase/dehydratase family protein